MKLCGCWPSTKARVGCFAGLEKQQVTPIGDGGGFQAQHKIYLECAAYTNAMLGVCHDPVVARWDFLRVNRHRVRVARRRSGITSSGRAGAEQ